MNERQQVVKNIRFIKSELQRLDRANQQKTLFYRGLVDELDMLYRQAEELQITDQDIWNTVQ